MVAPTSQPRMEISRQYHFDAAHMLTSVPEGHKCGRMHGHSFRTSITISGEVDPASGWVMDFAQLDEHVAPTIALLDHHSLNDISGLENPTSENLVVWLWAQLSPRLPLVEISVHESANSSVTYRGEMA